ncbi:hypothetical protein QJS10_CPA06g01938 [Acorus calamus]|uniref:Uncharacterized protein n=1 Tax=Acorus calamus TaxID=4465 RepID=A0AAV9EKB5_ACOCL|nr:hypothetical protein QJS10_CPA06g01938 [Acorus calamus]
MDNMIAEEDESMLNEAEKRKIQEGEWTVRSEDLEWLSLLSESEIDFLITIKQLAVQKAEVIGHKEIAAKFDVRILRALSVILLEFLKEQVRSNPTFPNPDEVLISLDRCSLATSDRQGMFGSSSIEEIFASLESNRSQARMRTELCDGLRKCKKQKQAQ